MSSFMNLIADHLLSLGFFVTCGLILLEAHGIRPRGQLNRLMLTPLIVSSIILVVCLGSLLVATRVGVGENSLKALIFAIIAGAAIVHLTRRSRVRPLVLIWFAMLALGLVWAFRMQEGKGASVRELLILAASLSLLVWGALSSRLSVIFLRTPPALIVLAGLVLIALPMAFEPINGAFLSASIPGIGTIQTGELGRLLLLLWLARSLDQNQPILLIARSRLSVENIRTHVIITMPVLMGVVIGFLNNDFGPSMVLSGATLAVVVVAGLGYRYLVWTAVVGALGIALLGAVSTKIQARWSTMLNPIPDPPGDITQVGQGLLLLAHGPAGLGKGLPNLVPLAVNDMLMAAMGHELGILTIGSILILMVAVVTASRNILSSLSDNRAQFAVAGIVTSLTLQSVMMISAVLSAAPLTGMPIPFLSISGSSLITSSLGLAIVISIIRNDPGQPTSIAAKRRIAAICLMAILAILALLARVVYLGVTSSSTITAAGNRDQYTARKERVLLPSVTTKDGIVIATTTFSDANHPRLGVGKREYPRGALYGTVLGTAIRPGLESALAKNHSCEDPSAIWSDDCHSLKTTLHSNVQQVASEAMSGKTGAVVAVDTRTGGILAYVSTLEGVDLDPRDRVRTETIASGSTAKIVSGAVALEHGLATKRPIASVFRVPGGALISAVGDVPCGGTLERALTVSCNPYFAALGVELGAERLYATSRAWLNNQSSLSGMQIAGSTLVGNDRSSYMAAVGAIGLGDTQVTPLGLLQVTAQIARGGDPVCLHLVENEASGCTEQKPMKPQTASALTKAMRAVVQSGNGTARGVPGLATMNAAAKTGTADIGDLNNATFSVFAPYDNPRVAVVAFLEPGPTRKAGLSGSKHAGPVASAVLAEALKVTR